MDGGGNPNVETRPKQARSLARRAALIERGAALLENQELDELSIAEMTAALGYSTGSFYSYFRDKEAFFVAVQRWVNEELDAAFAATFAEGQLRGLDLPDRLRICVDFALDYFRRRTGVIRSALRYERRIAEAWAPNRERTEQVVLAATEGLAHDQADKLKISLQLAFGLMVNALLHEPGPLKLEDKDLTDNIIGALSPYLS